MSKRRKISNFLDVEAQVDSDEEDEEFLDEASGHSSDLEDGFLANEAEEAEAARHQSTLRSIHHLQKQQAATALKEEDLDAEEERLRRLYGQERFSAADQDESTVPSQFLLPTPTDPKLWLVRCKPGKEREVARLIQHKFANAPKGSMLIQAIVARESLKGYIYVEALKQAHVIHAIQGVHNVYLSQKVALVPMAEMPHVLSHGNKGASKQSASFTCASIGAWARVKRGKYVGDVGQVIELLDAGGERVRLRLIPKVLDKRMLFNPKEISMLDKLNQITKSKGYWCYRNEEYNAKDGFLEKEFASSTLEIGASIFPTLEEMKLFTGASSLDSNSTPAATNTSLSKATVQFFAGDRVVVCGAGEHQGSKATVDQPPNDQGILTVQIQGSALKVRLSKAEVKKFFVLGDHVQVCNGMHKGESGLIVALEEDRYATLFCDTSATQWKVFVNDLTLATNANSSSLAVMPQSNGATGPSASEGSQVAVGDFVQWNGANAGHAASNFGLVIRWLGGKKLCVLNANSQEVQIDPAQIIPSNKRALASASALDAQSRAMNVGDLTEVLDGPHSKTQATIAWIHRGICFLKSKQHGILAVQSSNLINLSFKGGVSVNKPATALSSMNSLARNLPTDWELRGKSVMIIKGAFKGYLGVARELIGPTNVSVELHTASKTVTVRRADVELIAGQQQSTQHQPRGFSGRREDKQLQPEQAGNYLPVANATAAAAAASGKTPTWEGGKTPSWDGGAAGGKTPVWGGGKTPVWGENAGGSAGASAGGRTPTWGSNAGGRTPTWGSNAGGRTPVWGNAPEKSSDWDSTSNFSNSAPSPAKQATAPPTASKRPTRTAFGTAASEEEPAAPPIVNWGSMKSHSHSQSQPQSQPQTSWLKKGFCVKATSGIHSERHFIVASPPSASGSTVVECKDLDDKSFFLEAEILEAVRPVRRDAVSVLSGEDAGREGVLVSVDGQECIVKMNDGDEMKVLALDQLVKLHQQ